MRKLQVSPVRRSTDSSIQRSHTPSKRSSGSESTSGPSASSRSKGFWTEMSFKDENGKPKTMKAWVPYEN